MAANDLMMRIQLLIQGGRSSAELKRLQAQLKSLTDSLRTLESTKITPLIRDIGAIQRATAGLRGVNLNNFTSELDAVKKAFSGLGLGTTALDSLRAKYQALNSELASGALRRFQSDLNQNKQDLQRLRTTEIVPLGNEIRKLQSLRAFDKLGIDKATANLRTSRAQLALWRNEFQKLAQGGASSATSSRFAFLETEIPKLQEKILKSNLDIARSQQSLLGRYGNQLALNRKNLAEQKNIEATTNNQVRGLNQQVAAQKAKEQSIKREIQELTRLNTAQANSRKLQLQTDLAGAKGTRSDLRNQIRDTQDAAKAELRRIQATEAGTRSLNRQGGALTSLGRQFLSTTGIIRQFGSAMAFALGPQALGLVAAFKVVDFAAQFFQANKEIENLNRGLNSLTGGNADLYFSELVKAANTTGQSLHVVTDSYLQLIAASKGTRLEGAATREIFQSVSQALVITGADAVRSRRAFLALAQMMSKGQVFAEELRQQLSEALPGAVQIFARALNVNPQEMFDLMQQGRISSEALILFAQQLQQEMPALSEDLFTFSQKAALLQNSVRLLFKEVGDTGIWDSFGNGLLRARNLVDSFRSNIGGIADSIKNEFRFSAAVIDLSGIKGPLQVSANFIADSLDLIINRLYQLYDAVRLGVAEGLIRIGSAAGELSAAFGVEIKTDGFLEKLKELDVQALEFITEKAREAAQGVSDLFSGAIEGKLNIDLNTAQRNLKLLEEQTRLTREEFERLTFFDRLQATGPTPVDQSQKGFKTYEEYLAIVEKVAQAERASVAEIQRRIALQQQQKKAGEETIEQLDQLSKDREFIKLFDPKERETVKNLRDATINLQRVQEDALRINKENERSLLNRIKQTNSVWGIERDILATIRRAREVEAERIGDRNKDAMDSLKLELDRAKAIEQSKQNDRELGTYAFLRSDYSDRERLASDLRRKAEKELKDAAIETNNEIKKGALERARLLIEEANQLSITNGRTFAVKQGYDQLKKIQEQLSAVKEREVADELKLAELQNIRAKAAEAYANATDQSGKLTGAERTEWAKVADAILKAQVALEADLGFGQNAIEAERLRKTLDEIVQTDVGKIETRINKALQERTQASFEDLKTALEEYKKERAALLALRADLIAQGAGQPGATDLLNKELNDINRRIGQEDQRLKALRDNFADAKLDPDSKLPDLVFPILLAEMSSEELKKIQDAANQRKIELETGVKIPTEPVQVELQPVTQEEAKTFLQNVKEVWNDIFKMPPAYNQEPDLGFDNEAATSYFDNWRSINQELVVASNNVDALRAAHARLNQQPIEQKPIQEQIEPPEPVVIPTVLAPYEQPEFPLEPLDLPVNLDLDSLANNAGDLASLGNQVIAPFVAAAGIGIVTSIVESLAADAIIDAAKATGAAIQEHLSPPPIEIDSDQLRRNYEDFFNGVKPPPVEFEVEPIAPTGSETIGSSIVEGAARGLRNSSSVLEQALAEIINKLSQLALSNANKLGEALAAALATAKEIDGIEYNPFVEGANELVEEYLQNSIRLGTAVAGVGDQAQVAYAKAQQATEQYAQQIERSKQALQGFREQLDALKGTPAQIPVPDTAPVLHSLDRVQLAASLAAESFVQLQRGLQQGSGSPVFIENVLQSVKRLIQEVPEARQIIQILEEELKRLQGEQPQIALGVIADTPEIQRVKEQLLVAYSNIPASIKPIVDQAAAQQAQASISNTIKAIPVNLLPPITVGITPDLDQAKVAEQSQALRTAFQQQGVTINVDVVVDKNEITGVEKTLNRLTATDRRVEISARTELLDRELQRIDSQFQEFNRTAGAGLTPGFQSAGAQAQQFGALVDQVNLKMRETQRVAGLADTEVQALLDERRAIELQIKMDRSEADKIAEDFHRETQEKLTDPDPIRLIADPSQLVEAQRLIGEVQSDLQKLKDAGATNIEVRLDKDTGQLVVTADTSQADASVNAIISRIESSNTVLRVKVVYDDPGFRPSGSSTNVSRRRWGGPISGYGGGDKVRALLEPGEFVLRKEAARALGLERLMKLNRMGHQALNSFKTPRMDASHIHVPRFAEGGPVGGQPIIINVPGSQPIRVSGSRDQATALANLLARTGRAL